MTSPLASLFAPSLAPISRRVQTRHTWGTFLTDQLACGHSRTVVLWNDPQHIGGVDGLRPFVLSGDVVRDGGGWWIGGDEKRVLKVGGLALGMGGDAASGRGGVATTAEAPHLKTDQKCQALNTGCPTLSAWHFWSVGRQPAAAHGYGLTVQHRL